MPTVDPDFPPPRLRQDNDFVGEAPGDLRLRAIDIYQCCTATTQKASPRMGALPFRRPQTGQKARGWIADEPDDGLHAYVGADCRACAERISGIAPLT